jgi:hypothetical protein
MAWLKWGQGWHLQIAVIAKPCNRLWGNIEKAMEELKTYLLY